MDFYKNCILINSYNCIYPRDFAGEIKDAMPKNDAMRLFSTTDLTCPTRSWPITAVPFRYKIYVHLSIWNNTFSVKGVCFSQLPRYSVPGFKTAHVQQARTRFKFWCSRLSDSTNTKQCESFNCSTCGPTCFTYIDARSVLSRCADGTYKENSEVTDITCIRIHEVMKGQNNV